MGRQAKGGGWCRREPGRQAATAQHRLFTLSQRVPLMDGAIGMCLGFAWPCRAAHEAAQRQRIEERRSAAAAAAAAPGTRRGRGRGPGSGSGAPAASPGRDEALQQQVGEETEDRDGSRHGGAAAAAARRPLSGLASPVGEAEQAVATVGAEQLEQQQEQQVEHQQQEQEHKAVAGEEATIGLGASRRFRLPVPLTCTANLPAHTRTHASCPFTRPTPPPPILQRRRSLAT